MVSNTRIQIGRLTTGAAEQELQSLAQGKQKDQLLNAAQQG